MHISIIEANSYYFYLLYYNSFSKSAKELAKIFIKRFKNHKRILLLLLCSCFISIYHVSFIQAEFIVPPEWPSNNTFLTSPLTTQISQGPPSLSETFYSASFRNNSFSGEPQTLASPSALNTTQSIWPHNSRLNFPWTHNYNSIITTAPWNQITPFGKNFYQIYYGNSLPSLSPAEYLSKGRVYYLDGEYELSIEELKKANNFFPMVDSQILLLLGMAYQALGNEYLEEAEKYLKKAVIFQSDNIKARLQLAEFYYQQGRYDEAVGELKGVVEKEPENGEAVKFLALSYFKANDLTKALSELHRAEIMDPNNLEILYTIGSVLHEKHLFAEALPYYKRVIELMPESTWAQEARDNLQNIALLGSVSTIEDLNEETALLINSAPGPDDVLDLAIMILLDEINYKLLPDDTLINTTHKLFKILADRGKEAGEIILSYDSSYQTIRIDLARVINSDGTIIGVGSDDIQEVAPYADSPFYSNTKLLIISMPGIRVGSVVEYQVTIEDIPASKSFTPREIDKGFVISSSDPTIKARIEVSVPADREFTITYLNSESIEPEIIVEEGMKKFLWNLINVPVVIVQPMMPPLLDISPIINISSIPSWEIIADWWRELALEAMVSNDEIRSQVQKLTENFSTPKDKAKALFNYVAAQIRYVGIEYGKGSVKPRQASQIYDNKYGDCKDKSILLITMLKEIGIAAYPVLISTTFNGRAWEDVPRIDVFNHVITLCSIDDERIWLDPTVETISFGDIHGAILDREALIIFDDGYEFTRLPLESEQKNMEYEKMTIQVAEDSSAIISSTFTTTGINAIYRRAFFKGLDPLYRIQNLEATVTGRATGGKLLDFAISDPEDLNNPHKIELIYAVPNYIEWEGDTGSIEPSIIAANKAAITNDLRLYPVFLGNTSIQELEVHIDLPESIEISLPPSITLEIPQIIFISEYSLEDQNIIYHLRYEKKDLYIPIEDYFQYKELQEQVDKELKKKIVLKKK